MMNEQPEQHVNCSEVWKWSDKRHDKVRPFLVCKVLYIATSNVWCVMCHVLGCLFLAKVRCPWRTCMYVCNVCMYVLSNMWLLYFSSEQSAWVGEHIAMTPAPNPAPSSSPSPVQEEDYQLWDARDREDTRKGKGFMVKIHLIFYILICPFLNYNLF